LLLIVEDAALHPCVTRERWERLIASDGF